MTINKAHCIAVPTDLGSNLSGASEGPLYLKNHFISHDQLEWEEDITQDVFCNKTTKLEKINRICQRLSQTCENLVREKKPTIVLAGDHSSAIGTWSGVSKALSEQNKPLGLIWIDAHLDAHTMTTSETKNAHGMPAAALLGYGDSMLTQIANKKPKVAPENLFYIGTRSYESQEYELLKSLNVKMYDIETIHEKQIDTILKEIMAELKKNKVENIGLTVDLDVVDPVFAPAITVPEENGMTLHDVITVIKTLNTSFNVVAYELCEYSPANDIDDKSLRCCIEIINSMLDSYRHC